MLSTSHETNVKFHNLGLKTYGNGTEVLGQSQNAALLLVSIETEFRRTSQIPVFQDQSQNSDL